MPKKEIQLYVGPETPNAEEVRKEMQEHVDREDVMYFLTKDEVRVMKVLLDRQRTSEIVHGGLKSLLQLNDTDADVLLHLLKRI